jgi:hypothetical protein
METTTFNCYCREKRFYNLHNSFLKINMDSRWRKPQPFLSAYPDQTGKSILIYTTSDFPGSNIKTNGT